MSYRLVYRFSAAILLPLAAGLFYLALNDRSLVQAVGGRLLAAGTLCLGVWGLVMLLFSFTGPNDARDAVCGRCRRRFKHLDRPAFQDTFPCPACGGTAQVEVPGLMRMFPGIISIPPPRQELATQAARTPEYELASDGRAVPVAQLLAALGQVEGFILQEDEAGLPLLRTRPGIPTLQRNPVTGVLSGRLASELRVRFPLAEQVRAEDLVLASSDASLVAATCRAIAGPFGPLRVRVKGNTDWIAVAAEEFERRLVNQGLGGLLR